MLGAEVDDPLGVEDPANGGAADVEAPGDQLDLTDGVGLESDAQLDTNTAGILISTDQLLSW